MLHAWAVLEPAFHAEFGADLSELLHVKTWRWFTIRVAHLLSTPNRFQQLFAPDPE